MDVVTPCAGVWIEISISSVLTGFHLVTPCAGVWIEIWYTHGEHGQPHVTPCAGVWIEITSLNSYSISIPSLPVRECGLKYVKHHNHNED